MHDQHRDVSFGNLELWSVYDFKSRVSYVFMQISTSVERGDKRISTLGCAECVKALADKITCTHVCNWERSMSPYDELEVVARTPPWALLVIRRYSGWAP